MCGIAVLYGKKPIENSDYFLRKRGPDSFSFLEKSGFYMSHYLLHLTGLLTKQPIVDGEIYCVFNGEIYNYKNFGDFNSDSFAIIESYRKYGKSFVQKLDGEFALFLIDFKERIFFISTDVFGTKPLYISFENGLGLASYESYLKNNGYLDVKRVEPNTTMIFDFNFNLVEKKSVYDFNLEQFKTTFEDWDNSFISSVEKRFKNVSSEIILPLSSGVDSGALACVFNILNIDYVSYSYTRNEDYDVLQKRLSINKNSSKIVHNNPFDKQTTKSKLIENCEVFFYGYDYTDKNHFGFDDPGALGLYNLIETIKLTNPSIRILASGQGADEIMSNIQTYKFRNPNPTHFPSNLSDVFPWDNFYKGAQSSYLTKEEFITGSFGVESRYVYLDKKLVQEFLNLIPELKNSFYKSPIVNFLRKHDYPINYTKCGFNPS